MKNLPFLLIAAWILVYACAETAQPNTGGSVDAVTFSQKITEQKQPVILDVRTPGEFAAGYIAGAVNIPVTAPDFTSKVSDLSKSTPVFVYCLSGSRSQRAAASLREAGFAEVYELKGGLMKWRAAQLPLVTGTTAAAAGEDSAGELTAALASGKAVLIDFYAPWCGPCKVMAPDMEAIGKEHPEVQVVRINADESLELVQQFGVEALPTLIVMKDKKVVWNHTGYLDKAGILSGINL